MDHWHSSGVFLSIDRTSIIAAWEEYFFLNYHNKSKGKADLSVWPLLSVHYTHYLASE
jgi:hypothetical protein